MGEGMARGKEVGLRLPLGSDCIKMAREEMENVGGI
jgi:hypothetical protein